jgi:hypothetical protein
MTPKEKAKELYLKFYVPDYCQGKPGLSSDWRIRASKKNALNVCDEFLNYIDTESYGLEMDLAFDQLNYWKEVKKEIENL